MNLNEGALLSKYTTLGTGGPAYRLGSPGSTDELVEMLAWAREEDLPVAAVGLVALFVGALATVLALKVQSVQALWFFTSDLVFVLLFPQLLFALFDPKANRTGSIAAFVVSLVLRVGGGEPLLGLPAFIHYPETLPFRTVAAVVGLVLLPVVSRATAHWDAPLLLRNAPAGDVERDGLSPAGATQ